MRVEIRKSFSGKNVPKNIKFIYDKTSKTRPAWIFVKNLQKNVRFLSTRINGHVYHYKIYLSTITPLFLPTDYTKEEVKSYYDKFSQLYDCEIGLKNSKATEFLFNKYKISKNSKILDLGAGSGLSSIPLLKKGYTDLTLLDFSKEMLAKAKKKKELKGCKFINQDILKLKSNRKYDVIFSVFSFALNSYFDDKDMPVLWKKINSILKPNGLLMLMGNDFEPPKSLIKKVKKGKYEIIKGLKVNWFIGGKNE